MSGIAMLEVKQGFGGPIAARNQVARPAGVTEVRLGGDPAGPIKNGTRDQQKSERQDRQAETLHGFPSPFNAGVFHTP
jgi:hypothetical protein